jgi:hypothetical protein
MKTIFAAMGGSVVGAALVLVFENGRPPALPTLGAAEVRAIVRAEEAPLQARLDQLTRDVEALPTHGGSLRVYGCHAEHGREPGARVTQLLAAEEAAGLRSLPTYTGFQARAESGQTKLAENISLAMDGEKTLSALGREHQQFDLPAFDEVNHLVLIAAGINVGVSGNLNGARILRLAPQ